MAGTAGSSKGDVEIIRVMSPTRKPHRSDGIYFVESYEAVALHDVLHFG
jgi:hypothetical protein